MSKLTPKQQLFVAEYLVDLNATQAAIRAGYSKKTAYSTGFENLRKPEIQKAIQAQNEKRMQRTEINADYVLQKSAQFLEANLADFLKFPEGGGEPYFDLSNATREQLACLETLQIDRAVEMVGDDENLTEVRKIKLGLPRKKDMLELLGKHVSVGAFKDSQVNVNVVVVKDFSGRGEKVVNGHD